jgi:hypothetical protein
VDYKITVTDSDTGSPVKGALVQFLDYDGQSVIAEMTTGSAGQVVLDGTANPAAVDSGGYNVTAAGYRQAGRFPGSPLSPAETIEIERVPVKVPVLVVLGAGALLYASAAPRKKVSGVGDYAPYVVPVAMAAGIGLLVYKVGQKFGLFDDAEAQRQKQEAAQREQDAQASMAAVCMITPSTMANGDWVAIADKLEAGLDYAGYLQSYADDVTTQLMKAQNDCDVQKLIYYFGHRQLRSPFLIKSGDYTLSKGILERLSATDVDTVNGDYQDKGISFQW